MPFSDLRHFVSALEDIHELRNVEGANWNLEIGVIAELNYKQSVLFRATAAILF